MHSPISPFNTIKKSKPSSAKELERKCFIGIVYAIITFWAFNCIKLHCVREEEEEKKKEIKKIRRKE